jgi:nucleotide-binding universal stress UspA family protein
MTRNAIVVGFDGPADARRAAKWALDEAERTGAPVEIAHAAAVVLGVGESENLDCVLSFALAEAAGRGVALRIIRAWQPPALEWSESGAVVAAISAAVRERLIEQTARWREKYPTVPVAFAAPVDDAGIALTQASIDAQLVVVGPSNRGPLGGALLGSTVRHLLHHSACPVAVVRGGDDLQPR